MPVKAGILRTELLLILDTSSQVAQPYLVNKKVKLQALPAYRLPEAGETPMCSQRSS